MVQEPGFGELTSTYVPTLKMQDCKSMYMDLQWSISRTAYHLPNLVNNLKRFLSGSWMKMDETAPPVANSEDSQSPKNLRQPGWCSMGYV